MYESHSAWPIPHRMIAALNCWIEHGIEPGHFLTAVLCNDLHEACRRADDENRHLLFEYVCYLHNECPSTCWGSKEKFKTWKAGKGRVE